MAGDHTLYSHHSPLSMRHLVTPLWTMYNFFLHDHRQLPMAALDNLARRDEEYDDHDHILSITRDGMVFVFMVRKTDMLEGSLASRYRAQFVENR